MLVGDGAGYINDRQQHEYVGLQNSHNNVQAAEDNRDPNRDHRKENQGDEITGWIAICEGGKAVTLAPYYAVPGRIETVLASLPASAGTNPLLANEAALPCSAESCVCLT